MTRSPDPTGTPTFSDSWVLLAVAYAGGKRGADLASVVAAADYINHAILTYEEASASLARLIGLGLVRSTRGKFGAAPAVLALLPRGRSKVDTNFRRVEAFLRENLKTPKKKARFSLPRATFERAVESYLAGVR